MSVLTIIALLLVGFSAGYSVKHFLVRRVRTSGTIYVTHGEEKTLYSLELSDYPETLEFKKQVVFKVDALDKNFNRE